MWGPEPITARRYRALVGSLPVDSAFLRALAPDRADWRTTEDLLALLVELTDLSLRTFISANQKKGTPAPKPFVEIHRPGDTPKARRQATPAELAAFLARTAPEAR